MGIDEKERERAILDVTAELLLRHGYNKVTMSDVAGCARLTTVLACAYARFTSSLRAKFGICAGEVALWHCPQRFCTRTLFQKFTSKAWTSAVAGAGPV